MNELNFESVLIFKIEGSIDIFTVESTNNVWSLRGACVDDYHIFSYMDMFDTKIWSGRDERFL